MCGHVILVNEKEVQKEKKTRKLKILSSCFVILFLNKGDFEN